jgi:ribosomal protein L37E
MPDVFEDERCDRCGAHAFVMVSVPSAADSALGFCSDHWRSHQSSITTVPGVRVAYSRFEALAHA